MYIIIYITLHSLSLFCLTALHILYCYFAIFVYGYVLNISTLNLMLDLKKQKTKKKTLHEISVSH